MCENGAARRLGDEEAEREHAAQGTSVAHPEDDVSLAEDAPPLVPPAGHRRVHGQRRELPGAPGAGRGRAPEIAAPAGRFHPVGRFRGPSFVVDSAIIQAMK